MIKELDLIALSTDLPAYGLKQEDRGTVVHVYKDGAAYEVEFIKEGKTVAVTTLKPAQVRPYHPNPKVPTPSHRASSPKTTPPSTPPKKLTPGLKLVLQELIRRQRPYYLPEGSPIRGLDNQHWILFNKHRDADSLFKRLANFLRFGDKQSQYKFLRIDFQTATITEYIPRPNYDLPSRTLIRTAKLSTIEEFLQKVSTTKESALQANSFLGITGKRRPSTSGSR
ncbi:MAG: DUF4926 domain-containing protein [Cyanobacteriota bacterium]|nr:DUF4926 domain-containing protein [Cyanobacteriota bacterium]